MTSRQEQRDAKRGMVIEIKDQEPAQKSGKTGGPGGGWGQKLMGNDWKR